VKSRDSCGFRTSEDEAMGRKASVLAWWGTSSSHALESTSALSGLTCSRLPSSLSGRS